jgi:hypothetical protein
MFNLYLNYQGDFLGIHMPYIEERSPGDLVLMYTDCTTLFCLPLSELIKVSFCKAKQDKLLELFKSVITQDPNVKKFKNDPKSKLNFQDKSVNIYSPILEIFL